jgi:DNA-directed RNA polymerase subunit RPC12/RpoP
MAFQFLCPQGHLLQADDLQAGEHCKCPYCRAEFLVPPAARDPRPDHFPVARAQTADRSPVEGDPAVPAPEPSPAEEAFPKIHVRTKAGADPGEVAAQLGLADAWRESLLHIPCPRGHVLETPRDMLGQDAMCPHCQAEFRLRVEDSQEYRRARAEEQQRREQKLGKAWLHWAIATAVVVVLALIAMVVVAAYR